ncbi:porin family protein [Xanthomarina gelatinilytica]|uniref:porin family protein n=1 Tax=Xanthomarina gelatinilytica TaxID=1137281 RepID=UPI003AA8CBBE
MKKIILIAALTVFCLSTANAQQIKFGVKAGLNISSLRGDYPDEINETRSKMGFHLGGLMAYAINDKISIQPELLFSTQGGSSKIKQEYGDGSYYESFQQTPKLSYLNLPIMFKYMVIDKLSVEIGPQLGYVLSAKSEWEYVDSTDSSENETIEVDLLNGGNYNFLGANVEVDGRINRFDFGLNFGSSYTITDNLFVQARYNLGLTSVDKNSTNQNVFDSWELKNSVFQFSVGFMF